MIPRTLEKAAAALLKKYPAITITGPRQSGKTTLARHLFPKKPYVNLEAPDIRRFAQEDPRAFFADYADGAILDEIQRVPELLSYLQPVLDDSGQNGRFILTGSQQFEMMQHLSQSLAGRTAILRLLPFSLGEIQKSHADFTADDWIYIGFYPRIHQAGLPPSQAYADYYASYVERDIRQLINVRNHSLFDRFVRLCAGRAGQILNLNSLAADAGITHPTAREWLSLLETSFIVFTLTPFFANTTKRLTKSPKLYFYDTGLAAWLCGITEAGQLATHPLRGAFFENLAVLEIQKHNFNHTLNRRIHYFRDNLCEVDVLWPSQGKFLPVEIKSGQTIATDFSRGTDYFRKNFHRHCLPESLIVYGGNTSRKTSDGLHYCPLAKLSRSLPG
ncbi:MAG: ATP-binding protein [Opitutaceae bacterium]|jgi:predicted AAA+ superfamily ATPase|nr:ATP-binding protein [Opitutaceae bacterium]